MDLARRRLTPDFTFLQGLRMVPASHAPGRAGQHFDLFDSISDKVKPVTTQYIVYACRR